MQEAFKKDKSSGFQWGTSHWLFTIVLVLISAASVAYYAHVNFASTNGNQFLSVAATLASIILAIVAIFIAISQLIYASHQGSQLDLRLAELRSSVSDLRPIQQSVSTLTSLVSNIRDEQTAFLNNTGKALLAQAPSVAPDSSEPKDSQQKLVQTILKENTNLYFAALGVIVLSHGEKVRLDDIRSKIVNPLIGSDPKTESELAKRALPITVSTVARLLKNFDLASFPSDSDNEDKVEIDAYLRAEIIERITEIEKKMRKKGGSSTAVADLYSKIIRSAM